MTLGIAHNTSVSPFLNLEREIIIGILPQRVVMKIELIFIKHLGQYLEYSKH